jgi:hypothetical protein
VKKKLIIFLTLVLILGISITVFAGPFADVPANNWAYSAVNQLAKDGIVEGYGNGAFYGDKIMSRYEMAIIVARAMEHESKAQAQDKVLIDKLAVEFAQELKDLGVRVANLEKNASTFKWSGMEQIRIKENDTIGSPDGYYNPPASLVGKIPQLPKQSEPNEKVWQNNVSLFLDSPDNDDVSFHAKIYVRTQDSDVANSELTKDGNLGFYQAYMSVKKIFPSGQLDVGRLGIQIANGWMFGGSYFDGAKLSFGVGRPLSGFIATGDYTFMPGPDMLGATTTVTTPSKANLAQLAYVIKNTTLYLGYMASANNVGSAATIDGFANPTVNTLYEDYDFGFASQISPDFQWTGEYAVNKSHTVANLATGDKVCWYTGIKYGVADKRVTGSQDVYVRYYKRGANAADNMGQTNLFGPRFNTPLNLEGVDLGYDLTLRQNLILNIDHVTYNGFSTATQPGNDIKYKPFLQVALNYGF